MYDDIIFLLALPNSSHYTFTPIKIVHKRTFTNEMFAAWLYFKMLGPLRIIKRKLYADSLVSALSRDSARCPTFSLTAAAGQWADKCFQSKLGSGSGRNWVTLPSAQSWPLKAALDDVSSLQHSTSNAPLALFSCHILYCCIYCIHLVSLRGVELVSELHVKDDAEKSCARGLGVARVVQDKQSIGSLLDRQRQTQVKLSWSLRPEF